MGREALEAAVAHYRGEKAPVVEEGTIICQCYGVTDLKLRRVIRENNLHTVEDVTNFTKAGGGCGSCIPDIETMLGEIWTEEFVKKVKKQERKMTNIQKIAMVQEIIETEIRPMLQHDGGDLELIDVQDNTVIISLRGTCTGCLMSDVTLANIEKKLKELVSGDLKVETE